MACGKHAGPPNCENGWKDGSCCCNCTNQAVVFKHPWNSDIGNGSSSEEMGWVCIIHDPDDNGDGPHVTFMDRQHGMCEMHWPNEERTKYVEVKRTSKKFGLSDPEPKSTVDKEAVVKKWRDAGLIPSEGPILREGWKLTEDDSEI